MGQKVVAAADLRPPSVPLVAIDPYFSIWSPSDTLAGADTVHWTGKPHRLTSLIKVDGKAYRLMGKEPADVPALAQTDLEVLPTRTVYQFDAGGVRLRLTFMTAALPEDLIIYSRPVTYVTYEAASTDGNRHAVQAYLDAGPEICVNTPDQAVTWASQNQGSLSVVQVGSAEQPILQKRGDDLRIDWGWLFVAAPKSSGTATISGGSECRAAFSGSQTLPKANPAPPAGGQRVSSGAPVLAIALDLGKIGAKPVSRYLMLAYDDEFSIQYFKHNLRPYWRSNGDDARAMLKKAAADYDSLRKRCADFDQRLMDSLVKAGGEKYARICALAYRQCHAANKVVADANGQPLMLPKENFSNGCIGTVDVIYPMAPQFLLLSPSLTKAMLVPILDYAMSPRWRWPFAPHDLGTYPHANGQVYGGGERTEENQMPVEETGNMLILLAALAQVEGNADFCTKYWPVLVKWADYLQAKGFDPENQLCTDDFAGHLAHNVNLSAKAICGLGAFGQLCAMRSDSVNAQRYSGLAKEFAAKWVAEPNEGDHVRLAFDKPGTWSQKYNLVWDRILGLNLFPASTARKEIDFYRAKQNTFGLPLDSRKDYTKLDWTLWTATLTQDPADFAALVNPVYRFLNETPSRAPMTDWFDTKTGKMVGFQARSVVGGVFLQMLYNGPEWKNWAKRDRTKASGWAPLPKPPVTTVIEPTSEQAGKSWRFTTERPPENWFRSDFDASRWKEGPGGFGTTGTPGAVVRTEWRTPDIWLRRDFTLSQAKFSDLQLRIHHDEDADVFINGVSAGRISGFSTDYETVGIRPRAQAAFRAGTNTIAVHCHQTSGGQYIDVGIVEAKSQNAK